MTGGHIPTYIAPWAGAMQCLHVKFDYTSGPTSVFTSYMDTMLFSHSSNLNLKLNGSLLINYKWWFYPSPSQIPQALQVGRYVVASLHLKEFCQVGSRNKLAAMAEELVLRHTSSTLYLIIFHNQSPASKVIHANRRHYTNGILSIQLVCYSLWMNAMFEVSDGIIPRKAPLGVGGYMAEWHRRWPFSACGMQ